MNQLKIIQHNIHSLTNTKKILLENYSKKEKIDIIMLSETWFKEDKTPKLPNFNCTYKNRQDGYGGVAIFVNKNVQYEEFKLFNLEVIEAIAIKTIQLNKNMVIISIYIPPNANQKSVKEELLILMDQINKIKEDTILAGDFNAHNQIWGDNKTCRRGKDLEEVVEATNLINLNNDESTLVTKSDINSVIDLTFISNSMMANTDWRITNENLGSDHRLIQMEVGNQITPLLQKSRIKIDTLKFQHFVLMENPDTINDLDDFMEVMNQAIQQSTIGNNNLKEIQRHPKSWWTEEMTKLNTEKKEALADFHKTKRTHFSKFYDPNISFNNNEERKLWETKKRLSTMNEKFLKFKKIEAEQREMIKHNKTKNWEKFCSNINPQTPSAVIWKSINKIQNKGKSSANFIRSNPEMGEEFMKKNFEESSNTTENHNIQSERTGYEDYHYDRPITIEEFEQTLNSKKNTAPGIDGISYEMIKLLPVGMIKKLVKILNRLWSQNKIPTEWKNIDIIPIQKPSKDPNDANSYRPISLIPVIAKIFNSILKDRLVEYITVREILPDCTYGFRKGRSTINCLNLLNSMINEAIKEKKYCTTVFLDISKAYDDVNLEKLCIIMDSYSIPPMITNWIVNFFSNRKVNMTTSSGILQKEVKNGIPQGSTLSPTIFNLYTADMHKLNTNNVRIIQYADDIVIVGWNHCEEECYEEIQSTIDQLTSLLETRNLKINTEKTVTMKIKPIRNSLPIRLTVNDIIIPEVNAHKFLGIYLDNQLNFRNHINKTKIECKKRTDIMKFLSNKHIGAHPSCLLNMYKGLIRSKLDYGSTLYGNATKTLLNSMETIQLTGIKIAMGMLKNTPSQAVLAESGEMPLGMRRSWLAQKESIKIWSQAHPSKKYINNLPLLNNNQFNLKNLTFTEKESKSIITILRQIEKPTQYPKTTKPNNLKIHENLILNGKPVKLKDFNQDELYKIYKEIQSTKFPGYQKIFTDGSKMESGVGFGVFMEDNNIQIKDKINDNSTILMAELKAIQRAINLAVEYNLKYSLILTDSQSSCKLLMGKKTTKTVEEIFDVIKANDKMEFNIQWIPGHCKIQGNEMADKLAKEATENNNSKLTKITTTEAELICKREIWRTWNMNYKEISQVKGIMHGKIQENIQKKPWFNGLQLTRNEIVILNRLRTNSGMSKTQKFKFKLIDNDLCDTCKVREDITHSIWVCTKFEKERREVKELKDMTNLEHLLKKVDQGIYKKIAKLIKKIAPDY